MQDFYPTPGTVSTVMYYTGINPLTGKSVYVTTDYREKQLQRALLQFSKPENARLVREALKLAGREDLIGTSPDCLVRPEYRRGEREYAPAVNKSRKAPAVGRSSVTERERRRQKPGATTPTKQKNVRTAQKTSAKSPSGKTPTKNTQRTYAKATKPMPQKPRTATPKHSATPTPKRGKR